MKEQSDTIDSSKFFRFKASSSSSSPPPSSSLGLEFVIQVTPDDNGNGQFRCSSLPSGFEGDDCMISISLSNFSGIIQVQQVSYDREGHDDSFQEFEDVTSTSIGENQEQLVAASHQSQEVERKRIAALEFFDGASCSNADGVSGQTILHDLVSSVDLTIPKLHDILSNDHEMAKQEDSNGRLPLHLLGNNSEILQSLEGQGIAKQCAILLIQVYPDAIICPDNNNHMPFVLLIHKWVKLSTELKSSTKSISGNNDDPQGFQTNNQSSNNRFPPVIIFQQVEWSFQMLSLAIDYIAGIRFDPRKTGRCLVSHKKQRQKRQALAQNLVSIPYVLKSILLLESNEIRLKLIDSSIIRQVMFCKESVDPWLTSMIRYKKGNSSERAIEYIEAVSQLTVTDFVGKYWMPIPQDEESFNAAKSEVYDHVKDLVDFLPSLVVLDNDLFDRAVSMPLVWHIINKLIATPFTVALTVIDFTVHLTTIFAIKQVSSRNTDFKLISICAIFSTAVYQLLRMIVEIVVLSRISLKITRQFVLSFWNLVNFAGIVGSMLALYFIGLDEKQEMRNPLGTAVVLGLLWLRFLGLLKNVNEQLATFAVALIEILFTVRYFLLVLLILIIAFGDMFHLIFVNTPSIDCSDKKLEPSAKDFCQDDVSQSYLRVYAILVGDVNYSPYSEPLAVRFMWVAFTFIGTVILLNVLIAVVTFSYESSHQYSMILFRRSRAEFAVSHVTVESFMSYTGEREYACNINHIGPLLLRYLLIIAFYTTVLISVTFQIASLYWDFVNKQGTTVALIITIAFRILVIACTIWGASILLIESLPTKCIPCTHFRTQTKTIYNRCNTEIMKILASVLFGINTSEHDGGEIVTMQEDDNDEVVSRIEKMEGMLERAVELLEAKDESKLLSYQ